MTPKGARGIHLKKAPLPGKKIQDPRQKGRSPVLKDEERSQRDRSLDLLDWKCVCVQNTHNSNSGKDKEKIFENSLKRFPGGLKGRKGD